jgi:hypothetical protein
MHMASLFLRVGIFCMAKMVGFFQQCPIHSQQVLEEQKEKGKKRVELVARGSIGPFWLLTSGGRGGLSKIFVY